MKSIDLRDYKFVAACSSLEKAKQAKLSMFDYTNVIVKQSEQSYFIYARKKEPEFVYEIESGVYQ